MKKNLSKSLLGIIALELILTGCDPVDMGNINSFPIDPAPIIRQEEITEISISNENVDQEIFGKFNSNYGTFSIEDIEYEGYKIGTDPKDSEELFILNTASTNYGIEELPGSFANVDSMDGICSISITYECDSDFKVLYGNDRNHLNYVQEIQSADEYTSYDIDFVDNSSFFRIETEDDRLSVKSLEIECAGEGSNQTKEYYVSGNRYVPQTDYSPLEGDSLLAPVCEVDEDENITNVTWKEYTYHSFEYAKEDIEDNGAELEKYALTDPVDVANYFILFNRIPSNYGVSDKADVNSDTVIQGNVENVDTVAEVFGSEYTRMVSEYYRNDGYVKVVPAVSSNRTNTGNLYYEFDVDLDGSYSVYSRGTGRIVGFVGGFYTNEDDTNVAVYTDDHYYTFCEYTNYGIWGERFDASGVCKAGKIYDKNSAESIVEIK